MSTITHITSSSQLSGLLSTSAKDKLAVIDFHATWCGPCKAIAPRYEAFSKQYTNVVFLKCDVDACQEVAREYGVSAMPTFVFVKGGSKVEQVRGANARAIESAIQKHSGAGSAGAFSGKGQTLGGSSPSPSAAPQAAMSDLSATIANLDPQVKLLGVLIVGYLVFWWFFT